jgi:aspartate kinase
VAIDPREVLRTDDRFGQAVPDREAIARLCAERLRPVIEAGDVPVTAGFVGATEDGLTTTLGRGGSDYSASLIGVALGASEVQIWTDVDGMMTADPRTVPAARTLPRVSFREASELAYFGAKVLHPATIRPAVEKNIPVRVLNTFRPDAPGTVIDETGDSASSAEPRVRAVAWKDGIATVSITSPRMLGAHGYLARVFEVFDRHATPVDVVTTSEVSVSMTVDRPERLGAIASDLSEFCQARIDLGMSLVCLVGEGLLESPQLVADVLAAVHPVTLRMLCLGSSDINLCLVVNEKDAKDVVRRLHARFLEGKP